MIKILIIHKNGDEGTLEWTGSLKDAINKGEKRAAEEKENGHMSDSEYVYVYEDGVCKAKFDCKK